VAEVVFLDISLIDADNSSTELATVDTFADISSLELAAVCVCACSSVEALAETLLISAKSSDSLVIWSTSDITFLTKAPKLPIIFVNALFMLPISSFISISTTFLRSPVSAIFSAWCSISSIGSDIIFAI